MERLKPTSISKLPILGTEFYYQSGDNPIGRRDIYFNERNGVNTEIFSIANLFPSDEKTRERITWSLRNNTPYASKELRISRGVSAYFSYDPNSQAVVIEWGKINY